MLDPIEARVPQRSVRLERLGTIGGAVAAEAPSGTLQGTVLQALDALDIVLAATLQSLFNVCKR
jgi:hypothetical protein